MSTSIERLVRRERGVPIPRRLHLPGLTGPMMAGRVAVLAREGVEAVAVAVALPGYW